MLAEPVVTAWMISNDCNTNGGADGLAGEVRDDAADRLAGYSAGLDSGAMTLDEVRSREDLASLATEFHWLTVLPASVL
jgi:hypothetical protein